MVHSEDISDKLEQLTAKQMSYVTFRTMQDTNAPAYRQAGYSKTSWYRIPEERRDLMNECAGILSTETKLQAIEVLRDAALGAAKNLIELAETAKNESVRLKANIEVLALGGVVVRKELDVTTGGDTISPLIIIRRADDKD